LLVAQSAKFATTSRPILARTIEAVTFIFAAFSGFLKSIAPPEETNSRFAVGTASFLVLCILLLVSATRSQRQRKSIRRVWIGLGISLTIVFAFAVIAYKHNLDNLTFGYPPENPSSVYVKGTEYTPLAEGLRAKNRLGPSQMVAEFGGLPNRQLVWSEASIERSSTILLANYLVLVTSVSGAVFSFVEFKMKDPGRSSNDSTQ
jgi:hypothetical protein